MAETSESKDSGVFVLSADRLRIIELHVILRYNLLMIHVKRGVTDVL